MTAWEVEFTDEFHDWWVTLDENNRKRSPGVCASFRREDRPRSAVRRYDSPEPPSEHEGTPLFETRSPPSVLCLRSSLGSDPADRGDKSNHDPASPSWQDWYTTFIPIADDLYDEHLRLIKQESD